MGVIQTLTFNGHESFKRRLGAIALARAGILKKKRLMLFHSLSESGSNPVDPSETENTIVLMRLDVKLLQLEHLYKNLLEVVPTELKISQGVK